MKTGRKAWLMAACAAALLTAAMASSAAWAQAPAAQEEETEIIVTGTRSRGITVTQSLSPIDVVSPEELTNQGSTDLTDQLTSVAPSINTQRFPIADGTAVIRPVNLRNLPPDQTLVMINGSRRHRSALVNLQAEPFGTVNQGAQAVDFQLIPAIAINRLEVLRDGASAQYGSDAIAGVINVILRDNNEGLEATAQYGKFYAGDGENYQVAANWGLPLGGSGFLNLSAEYVSSAITSRGSARPDAAAVAAFVGPNLVPFNGLGQRWATRTSKASASSPIANSIWAASNFTATPATLTRTRSPAFSIACRLACLDKTRGEPCAAASVACLQRRLQPKWPQSPISGLIPTTI